MYCTLKVGGYFLFNIEHPTFTAGVNEDWIYDENGKPKYWPIDNYYYPGERNRFMVDNSAYMIAVFNGDKGGTANTLHYAESKGLNIVIINPNDLSRDEKPLYRGLKLLK